MKNSFVSVMVLALTLSVSARAQRTLINSALPAHTTRAASLQALVNQAAQTALTKFADKKLTEAQLSITLIDLRDSEHPVTASFRGNERVYPASVVKLFYLVAVHRWLADKKIQETPELKRAVRDMIVDSSNEATQYVLDVLTHTTGGFELSPKEMEQWQYKRNAVNRYYSSLGFTNINVNQKTFCEDAYGRERVSRGPAGENRNKLTTDATARLLAEIATGHAVDSARSAQMMELLKRDFAGPTNDNDDQGRGFSGIALQGIPGARLWSKAGWTSTTRHDAAYIELPGGAKFVLVTFTTDHATEREIIPTVARVVIEGMGSVKMIGEIQPAGGSVLIHANYSLDEGIESRRNVPTSSAGLSARSNALRNFSPSGSSTMENLQLTKLTFFSMMSPPKY
jgi:beta-lactamase class A